MSDDLSAEFESYRTRLRTEEEKQAFDRKIKQLAFRAEYLAWNGTGNTGAG
jgi:hypothetical protein